MWEEWMRVVVGGAVGGGVVAWMQHLVRRYQMRGELRLTVIKEFNRLCSEFVFEFSEAPHEYKPDASFWKAWYAVMGDVEVLFSRETYQTFKRLEELIGPAQKSGGTLKEGPAGVGRFMEARGKALRALYAEVVPLDVWWMRKNVKLAAFYVIAVAMPVGLGILLLWLAYFSYAMSGRLIPLGSLVGAIVLSYLWYQMWMSFKRRWQERRKGVSDP